jgi:PP-loop superfamily ATP-utilizing enzyme
MPKQFVAVSGGADSTALALLLHERGEDFELCFSDTGAELPEVYWLLPRLAATIGKPLHVVGNGSFFQHLVSFGYLLPGPRVRWCTRLLKQIPQDLWYESLGVESVAIGIRADEPRRLHTNMKPRHGSHEFRYPLAEAGYGKKEVIELCRKHDLLNPVYQWRSNVSCFCCFFQRLHDWVGLLKHHPSLYAIAEAWERESCERTTHGYTWSKGRTLTALRQTDEDQLKLWPDDDDEEPCLVCAV